MPVYEPMGVPDRKGLPNIQKAVKPGFPGLAFRNSGAGKERSVYLLFHCFAQSQRKELALVIPASAHALFVQRKGADQVYSGEAAGLFQDLTAQPAQVNAYLCLPAVL